MNKIFFTVTLILSVLFLSAQENNLDEFVENQNEKLVYDASKLVQAPNTNIFIIPPEHFIEDPSINGFVHSGSATTIQIIEVPGVSSSIIEQSMSKDYIEAQNYILLEKINLVTENGSEAIMYLVRFTSNDLEYERAMFFTGQENTIWININYPVSIKKLIFPAIEACLKSVQY